MTSRQQHLDHELKGTLKLNSKENQAKTLTEVLLEELNNKNSARDTFSNYLTLLSISAPLYLPQLLEQIYLGCCDQEEIKEKFIKSLFNLSGNEQISKTILHSHPSLIMKLIIKKPSAFFKLSEVMQIELYNLLTKESQNETISALENIVTYFISNKNVNDLPDKKTKKTAALNLISAYLQLEPEHYKKSFFQVLYKEILQHGLSNELLQNRLHKADQKLLFANFFGSANSKAKVLMDKLIESTSEKSIDAQSSNEDNNISADALSKFNNYLNKLSPKNDAEIKYQQFLVNKGLTLAEKEPIFVTRISSRPPCCLCPPLLTTSSIPPLLPASPCTSTPPSGVRSVPPLMRTGLPKAPATASPAT